MKLQKTKISKKFCLVIILLIVSMIFLVPNTYVSSASSETESNLSSGVEEILDVIDLSEVQQMVDSLQKVEIFDKPVIEKLQDILNGKYFTNYSKVTTAIFSLIFGDIRSVIPFVFTIIAIGILCNLISNMKSDKNNTSDIINFVFLAVLIILVLVVFKKILSSVNSTINLINNQMQIFFPILLTLLTSIGSFTSVSIYNPLVAVLTNVVSFVFDKFLYPIFIVVFLFTILGNLTNTIKLDKINSFLLSTFKWTIGLVFTIFTGFLSIQGISAGKFDSVSIKATKFAMKSYIPIIGSYVSDGMDFLILGSVLVKNAIGLVGVFVIFVTIISPILTIIIYKLSLSLSAGVLELTGNTRFSNFLTSCAKILVLPIVLIIGIAFMYIITICLIMCTANIF